MKSVCRSCVVAVVGLASASFVAVGVAQTTNYVYSFDTSGSDASWIRWWGVAFEKPVWDPTRDASNNPASGSLMADIPFMGARGEQFCFFGNFRNVTPWDASVTLDGTKYSHVTFDILVAPGSAMTPAGNFGSLAIGLATPTWGQIWLNEWNLPVPLWPIPARATSEWVRCTIPIDPSVSGVNNVAGVIFKMWSDGAHTGRLTFWLDNITLVARQEEPQPPTLAIGKAEPGLHLFASQPGARWQRQCIRTTGSGYSWLSHPYDPMTYSVTIKDFPPPAYGGFQAHIFLVPEAGMPYGPNDGAIDWNAPNVIFVQITQGAGGSGSARFMYKTNQPGGNAMLWNTNPDVGPVGTLAFLGCPTVRGTWSVTLNASEENIVMTAPDGSSTNFAMPPALAAPPWENLFAGALYAYFGVQPNEPGNISQRAIFGRVQIQSGDPAFRTLEDDFSGPSLDPTKWTVVGSDAAGVFVAPPTSVYWLSWLLPDVGFRLQGTARLAPSSWSDLTPAILFRNADRRMALITVPLLPGPDAGFFQLVK